MKDRFTNPKTVVLTKAKSMSYFPSSPPQCWLVQICQHRSCQRHRSREVLAAFRKHQSKRILVAESGCMSQCSSGPTVHVMPDNTWYCRVQPQDVDQIVVQHLNGGKRWRDRLHPRFHSQA